MSHLATFRWPNFVAICEILLYDEWVRVVYKEARISCLTMWREMEKNYEHISWINTERKWANVISCLMWLVVLHQHCIMKNFMVKGNETHNFLMHPYPKFFGALWWVGSAVVLCGSGWSFGTVGNGQCYVACAKLAVLWCGCCCSSIILESVLHTGPEADLLGPQNTPHINPWLLL